jgi:hypothetical protein
LLLALATKVAITGVIVTIISGIRQEQAMLQEECVLPEWQCRDSIKFGNGREWGINGFKAYPEVKALLGNAPAA